MDKNEPDEKADNAKQVSNLAKFAGLGFQMIAVIGVFSYAGYKIDEALGHQVKWVTAILSLMGVFISLYMVIKSIKS
ncbi:MAG: AtpZ/AtpI family protein [Mucilaginibacter sp.]